MSRIRPGDRVYVKKPSILTERKIGTIVAAKNSPKGTKYFVEWETDLTEKPNGHHPGYRANEIVPIS